MGRCQPRSSDSTSDYGGVPHTLKFRGARSSLKVIAWYTSIFGIDWDLVWKTIGEDLPVVREPTKLSVSEFREQA
jgi:hypothetical protein